MQYYSFLQQTLLSPPDTFTTECHFCFGPAASFYLELFLIALSFSQLVYWTLSYLGWGGLIFIFIFLFILFMGFSWQEYWSGLWFPTPVDHILSELFTVTHPSWVSLHSMAHSFIELLMPFHHNQGCDPWR